jgi:monothiol glutaredoxin
MALEESVRKQITAALERDKVVVFMKGNRRAPQCGFSAQVVQILDALVPNYETVDVLQSPELRDGIKEFSQWPTIPQVYVAGQFVGGCDIVREMNASGELRKLLGAEVAAGAPPAIEMSGAAAKAILAAAPDAGGDPLHLQIDAQFQPDLFFGPRGAGDIEVVANGVTILVDPPSARLANGVRIDFIEGPGGGFKIENPNAPPKVKELSAVEAKALLDRREIILFDVRPETERKMAKIAAARSLDAAGRAELMALDRTTPIAFHCHRGSRSRAVAEQMVGEGFKTVYNLNGGIDAWSTSVDPSVPRY